MVLRLREGEVYGLDVVDSDTARPKWLQGIGGQYVDGRQVPADRVEKVVGSMWPGVPVVPAMAAGASDAIFTRNAGLPSYGISGTFQDIHDDREHGRDERIGVSAFYESVEFSYRLMKALSAAD